MERVCYFNMDGDRLLAAFWVGFLVGAPGAFYGVGRLEEDISSLDGVLSMRLVNLIP